MDRLLKVGDVFQVKGKAGTWIVEVTGMEGGQNDLHDYWPDGWHILARRLRDDLSYNPTGKLWAFYQTGCFNEMYPQDKVKLLETRIRVVDFVKEEEFAF